MGYGDVENKGLFRGGSNNGKAMLAFWQWVVALWRYAMARMPGYFR
jgi:hypothetical protein